MWYAVGAIVLIIIWTVWSRKQMSKVIKGALDDVNDYTPILAQTPIREVLGYCNRNNIECRSIRDCLIVSYEDKVITIKQDGGMRLGNCIYFTKL